MITSREIVKHTLEKRNQVRMARDLWVIPAAMKKYGGDLEALLARYPVDIARIENLEVQKENDQIFTYGSYCDSWGITWMNIQDGYFGEAKKPAIREPEQLVSYHAPLEHTQIGWENMPQRIAGLSGKYVIASQVNPFERMQFIRGVENLYMDLAAKEDSFFQIRDLVWEYFSKMLDVWLTYDGIDAISFSDDWGSQRALLISPEHWKAYFKPMYQDLIGKVKKKGLAVFVHCDGYIMDLYPEFIDLGVDAINSQLWCMDVEEIARRYAGIITFWGEISRQNTLPRGTPQDIYRTAQHMRELFYKHGGGLIGQCEVGSDVPLENIEAALTCWN